MMFSAFLPIRINVQDVQPLRSVQTIRSRSFIRVAGEETELAPDLIRDAGLNRLNDWNDWNSAG